MSPTSTTPAKKPTLWQRFEVILLVWVVVFFALMLVWPGVSNEPFPVPGTRQAMASDAFMRWTQCLLIIGLGLWLLYKPSTRTIEGLAIFQGMACALMLMGMLYFGNPYWGAYMSLNAIAQLRRTALKKREQESQNMRG